MLLAIDVGNTHVVIGAFRGDHLVASWRLQSDVDRTVDEYALEVIQLLGFHNLRQDISSMILSSVVPALTRVFVKLAQKYFGFESLVVGPDVVLGMTINMDNVETVGADRIVNAFAAREYLGSPVVIVDMGTATTFDIVGHDGAYEGGLIAPGLNISAQALFSRAAMLPSIQIKHPKQLIGKNTHDAMLAGIVYGYAGLIEGIICRIKEELMVEKLNVVATGGLASLIAEDTPSVNRIFHDLTLQGLRLIARVNKLTF